eukprot:TRINITY_DN3692_c0_g1_i2.p1 TRINITY_DN3692_c0_g1~~TRINITY_DN3692_c0_g1_i2.p1  ORF type:complete len:591 (-),score=202.20 TRINITY_DN3692_c0_g1_i2:105-1877(-)
MDPEQYDALERAFSLFWNMRIREGEEFIQPHLSTHPAFAGLQAEVYVVLAMLSERKEDFARATKWIANAKKEIESAYRPCRSALKAYQSAQPAPKPFRAAEVSATERVVDRRVDDVKLESSEGDTDGSDDGEESLSASSSSPTTFSIPATKMGKVALALFCKILQAECFLWDAVIKMKLQKYVKGAYDFRLAWKRYHECGVIRDAARGDEKPGVEGPDDFPFFDMLSSRIDFGLAVFHFTVSVVPRHFQWLVEGVGFKADRELSLMEFDSCRFSTRAYRAPLAGLMLSWINAFFFFEIKKAERLLGQETEKFPTCALYPYTMGYVHRKKGKIADSDAAFMAAVDAAEQLPTFRIRIEYELGYNNTLQLRWEPAIELLERYFTESKAEMFMAYCAFQLGLAYEMVGNRKKATMYMKKVLPHVRKNHAYDEYAQRKAKQFVKFGGFNEPHRYNLCATMLHEACLFEEAIEWLRKAESVMTLVDEKVCFHYLMGSCLAHQKKYDEAAENYLVVLEYEKRITDEVQTVPWSLCGLGELRSIAKDPAEARLYLNRAKAYKNYDFESFLGWRVRKIEDDLARMEAGGPNPTTPGRQ